MRRMVVALGIVVAAGSTQAVHVQDQETVIKRVWVGVEGFGVSREEEVTYYPSEEAYEKLRDDTLDRLRACDPAAFFNPGDGPRKQAETTTEWNFDLKVGGISNGRRLVREVVAAEEALEMFEKEGGRCPR